MNELLIHCLSLMNWVINPLIVKQSSPSWPNFPAVWVCVCELQFLCNFLTLNICFWLVSDGTVTFTINISVVVQKYPEATKSHFPFLLYCFTVHLSFASRHMLATGYKLVVLKWQNRGLTITGWREVRVQVGCKIDAELFVAWAALLRKSTKVQWCFFNTWSSVIRKTLVGTSKTQTVYGFWKSESKP